MNVKSNRRMVLLWVVILSLACQCPLITSAPGFVATVTPTFTPAEVVLEVDTETPTPSFTDTPVPTSTPRPTATPALRRGDVIIEDNFKDNANGWTTSDDGEMVGEVKDGAYSVEVLSGKKVLYALLPAEAIKKGDVDITLTATFEDGKPSNTYYGGLCRYQDEDNFYRFEVSGDGQLAVEKFYEGESSFLKKWTASSVIVKGTGKSNNLRIICAGDVLQFEINDKIVALISDGDLTEGTVGLLAGTFSPSSATVTFDDLVVKYADEIAGPTATPASGGGGGGGGGGGDVTIINKTAMGVRLAIWAGAGYYVDVSPGETLVISRGSLSAGAYGWKVFANGCEAGGDNIHIPGAVITLQPTSDQCGFAVSSR